MKIGDIIRKSIWVLVSPMTLFMAICHYSIFIAVDLVGMFFSFLANDNYKPFWITRDIWNNTETKC
jgi:hypothetical protein